MAENFPLKFQCCMEFSQTSPTGFNWSCVTASLWKWIFLISPMPNLTLHLTMFFFLQICTEITLFSLLAPHPPTVQCLDEVLWWAWQTADYCYAFHHWRSLSSNMSRCMLSQWMFVYSKHDLQGREWITDISLRSLYFHRGVPVIL